MTEVKVWTGAWTPIHHTPTPPIEVYNGSSWDKINALRPQNTSWLRTIGAMMRGEQVGWDAPKHMWVGDRWWPPENIVREQHVVPRADGSLQIWWYVDTVHHENDPAVSPMPQIILSSTIAAGKAQNQVLAPDANLTMTRARTPNGWWQYSMTWNAAAMTFIRAGLDITKPISFGVEGEAPYGPYQVSVFIPAAPHTPHPTHIAAPAKPTGLRVTGTTPTTISLTWTAAPGVLWEVTSGGHVVAVVSSPHYVDHVGHPDTDYHYQIRAMNAGGKSAPAATTGHSKPIPVDTSIKTFAPRVMWDGAYDGNHSRRSDHPSNPWQSELVTGRFDSTHGNTHSVVRFNLSGIPHGATITSVKLTMHALHWYSNAGGTAIIKNIFVGGSAQSHHTPESGPVTRMHWSTKTGTKTVTISTGQGFANGKFNAIQIGPATTTAQVGYGVFDGTGARKPHLTIKYHL